MKKIFLALLLLFPLFASAETVTVEFNEVFYKIDTSAKTAEVTKNPNGSYTGDITISPSVKYQNVDYDVTAIGNGAFQHCPNLTSIIIPSSVTSIGSFAFGYDTGLESINIPNGVTSIGSSTFYGCTGLESVNIASSVTSIGSQAFDGCTSLSSINIPNSVTIIGDFTFYNCHSLTSITIPNSVTKIEDCAFLNCTSLKSITIPSSVTSIGDEAFDSSVLTSISVQSGNTVFDSRNNCNAIVETATNKIIFGCINTTFPISVTSIGTDAFRRVPMTSITIPDNITEIEGNPFNACNNLQSITVESGNPVFDSRDNCNAIIEKANNTLRVGCQNTIIPNTVTAIGNGAFLACHGLTSITIPNSVISIGNSAFNSCTGLTSITIPNSVTSIGAQVFRACSQLKSVTLSNSIETISTHAFVFCRSLASVNIPNGVRIIDSYAFYGCGSLKHITLPESLNTIRNYAFDDCNQLTSVTINNPTPPSAQTSTFYNRSKMTLFVPVGSKSAYEAANVWKYFKEIVEFPATISMSSSGIMTYSSPYDLDFSEVSGLKAYIISGFSPSTGVLTLTPVDEVPAGEGLLLKGPQGDYDVPYTHTDMIYSNLLRGVTVATEISPTDGDETNFILSNGIHGIGFYTLSESGTIAANKAYLHLPTSAIQSLQSKGFTLVFEDETTGISLTPALSEGEGNLNGEGSGYWYSLDGRRVATSVSSVSSENSVLPKGVYIVNGKKVVIK